MAQGARKPLARGSRLPTLDFRLQETKTIILLLIQQMPGELSLTSTDRLFGVALTSWNKDTDRSVQVVSGVLGLVS